MDKINAAIAKILERLSKDELWQAYGIALAVLYPRERVRGENIRYLLSDQSAPRHFYELVWYEPVPVVIGSWQD